MSRLELSLFAGGVVEAPGETIVALVPSDERPLLGDAGRIDWRLDGLLSEHLGSGYATGEAGEALLFPATPPLRASRVLMLGVGPRRRLGEGWSLLRAMRSAAERMISLNCRSGLLAWPGSVDFEADAGALLRGLVQGFQEAPGDTELGFVLPQGERREKALLAAVSASAPDSLRRGVEVAVDWIEPDGD